MKTFDNIKIIKHPLVQDKLSRMRDSATSSRDFRFLLRELSSLMAFEVTRDIKTESASVRTPLGLEAKGVRVNHREIVLVTIFRAGVGMAEGVLEVIPQARVGHVGIYRNPETLDAVQYYHKLPPDIAASSLVLLIDPMLATGNTMVRTLEVCRDAGAENIRIMCLVAAPEGVEKVREKFKKVPIYTAALDEKLDDHGYIIPGLGDAGDRIFGTR